MNDLVAEQIIAKRYNDDNQLQYQILWLGSDVKTWESADETFEKWQPLINIFQYNVKETDIREYAEYLSIGYGNIMTINGKLDNTNNIKTEQIEQLNEENNKLQLQCDALKIQQETVTDKLGTKINILKQDSITKQHQIDILNEKLNKKESENMKIINNCNKQQQQIKKMSEQQLKLETLEKKNDKLKEQLLNTQKINKSSTNELMKHIETTTNSNEKMQQKIINQNENIRLLEQKTVNQKQQILTQKQTNSIQQEQIAKLTETVQTINESMEELKEYKNLYQVIKTEMQEEKKNWIQIQQQQQISMDTKCKDAETKLTAFKHQCETLKNEIDKKQNSWIQQQKYIDELKIESKTKDLTNKNLKTWAMNEFKQKKELENTLKNKHELKKKLEKKRDRILEPSVISMETKKHNKIDYKSQKENRTKPELPFNQSPIKKQKINKQRYKKTASESTSKQYNNQKLKTEKISKRIQHKKKRKYSKATTELATYKKNKKCHVKTNTFKTIDTNVLINERSQQIFARFTYNIPNLYKFKCLAAVKRKDMDDIQNKQYISTEALDFMIGDIIQSNDNTDVVVLTLAHAQRVMMKEDGNFKKPPIWSQMKMIIFPVIDDYHYISCILHLGITATTLYIMDTIWNEHVYVKHNGLITAIREWLFAKKIIIQRKQYKTVHVKVQKQNGNECAWRTTNYIRIAVNHSQERIENIIKYITDDRRYDPNGSNFWIKTINKYKNTDL